MHADRSQKDIRQCAVVAGSRAYVHVGNVPCTGIMAFTSPKARRLGTRRKRAGIPRSISSIVQQQRYSSSNRMTFPHMFMINLWGISRLCTLQLIDF